MTVLADHERPFRLEGILFSWSRALAQVYNLIQIFNISIPKFDLNSITTLLYFNEFRLEIQYIVLKNALRALHISTISTKRDRCSGYEKNQAKLCLERVHVE